MTESEESPRCNLGLIEDTEPSQNHIFPEHSAGDQREVTQLFSGHGAPAAPIIEVEIECSQSKGAEERAFNVDWRSEIVSGLTQFFLVKEVPAGTALFIEVKAAGSP